MEISSFHPSRKAAKEFAEDLERKGAEGVEVGRKTSAGYPVTSVVPDTRRGEIEARLKSHLPISTEKYGFETSLEPVTSVMASYEMVSTIPQRTREDIVRIAREELQKSGLGDIKVRISRYQGRDPVAPYSDATLFRRRGKYYIGIHPIHQYSDEGYLREVVQHEIGHILEDRRI